MRMKEYLTLLCILLVVLNSGCLEGGLAGVHNMLNELKSSFTMLAGALGLFMFSIFGLMFILSNSPQERDDAKKGMIYVVIGLLMVAIGEQFVHALYCSNIAQFGASC